MTLFYVGTVQSLKLIKTSHKMYPVEADTKVISMQQSYAVEYTTWISKQFHASTGCYINKIFILYTIH